MSGFYDLLKYGDEVMADKCFTIAEELSDILDYIFLLECEETSKWESMN